MAELNYVSRWVMQILPISVFTMLNKFAFLACSSGTWGDAGRDVECTADCPEGHYCTDDGEIRGL